MRRSERAQNSRWREGGGGVAADPKADGADVKGEGTNQSACTRDDVYATIACRWRQWAGQALFGGVAVGVGNACRCPWHTERRRDRWREHTREEDGSKQVLHPRRRSVGFGGFEGTRFVDKHRR